MNYIVSCFDGLVRLLYPHTCAGCGSDVVHGDQVICNNCFDQLPLTNFRQDKENPVARVFAGRLPLVSATAFMYFTKGSALQQLLHQLKYKSRKEIGTYLGRMMGNSVALKKTFSQADALVPLPLHQSRERKRGYNQATMICEGISEQTGLPVIDKAISRSKKTITQTHKGRLERWENIEGKFRIDKQELLKNKHVILVDDVITTGATLEACGMELIKIPGLKLSVASLAYTML